MAGISVRRPCTTSCSRRSQKSVQAPTPRTKLFEDVVQVILDRRDLGLRNSRRHRTTDLDHFRQDLDPSPAKLTSAATPRPLPAPAGPCSAILACSTGSGLSRASWTTPSSGQFIETLRQDPSQRAQLPGPYYESVSVVAVLLGARGRPPDTGPPRCLTQVMSRRSAGQCGFGGAMNCNPTGGTLRRLASGASPMMLTVPPGRWGS
jgi:hypothetical protein